MAGPTGPHSMPKGAGAHPITVPYISRWYRWTATGLGAGMWFFLFYRAKQDGAVLLGLKHPWDH